MIRQIRQIRIPTGFPVVSVSVRYLSVQCPFKKWNSIWPSISSLRGALDALGHFPELLEEPEKRQAPRGDACLIKFGALRRSTEP